MRKKTTYYCNGRKIINFSELSRYITGGDRNCLRPNKIPEKHLKKLDRFFYVEIRDLWDNLKKQNGKSKIKRHLLKSIN